MRRIPRQAMRMPKAWPAVASALNDQFGWEQMLFCYLGAFAKCPHLLPDVFKLLVALLHKSAIGQGIPNPK